MIDKLQQKYPEFNMKAVLFDVLAEIEPVIEDTIKKNHHKSLDRITGADKLTKKILKKLRDNVT